MEPANRAMERREFRGAAATALLVVAAQAAVAGAATLHVVDQCTRRLFGRIVHLCGVLSSPSGGGRVSKGPPSRWPCRAVRSHESGRHCSDLCESIWAEFSSLAV